MNNMEAAIREKLFPILEATLQEHCGSDCPSFSINPQFKKETAGPYEDLGFGHHEQSQTTPELKSVGITILVGDRVSVAARDSLKLITAHRLSNEVNVPVVVQLRPLGVISPTLDHLNQLASQTHTATTGWERLQPLAWPLTVSLLGVLGLLGTLLGLVLFFKYKMSLVREQTESELKKLVHHSGSGASPGTSSATQASEHGFESASELLQNRFKDLQWLIEERSAQGDRESLAKILALFPARDLTSRLKLSEQALRIIAWLPVEQKTEIGRNPAELFKWLSYSLDRAHWRMVEEERNPLMRLKRLSEEQLLDAFLSLPSLGEKAVMLAVVSRDSWPHLLSQLNSEERVQLGLLLSQYQDAVSKDRRAMEAALIQRISEALEAPRGGSQAENHVVEDFSLYLPEKEGQKLWQGLSLKSRNSALISVESLLQNLEPAALLEVCMRVDIKTWKALLPSVTPHTRTKILNLLPKGLRERLEFSSPSPMSSAQNLTSAGSVQDLSVTSASPDEAQLMKARAEFIGAYRRFQLGT